MTGLREFLIALVLIIVGVLLWPMRNRMWEKYPPKPWMFWAVVGITATTLLFCIYMQFLR